MIDKLNALLLAALVTFTILGCAEGRENNSPVTPVNVGAVRVDFPSAVVVEKITFPVEVKPTEGVVVNYNLTVRWLNREENLIYFHITGTITNNTNKPLKKHKRVTVLANGHRVGIEIANYPSGILPGNTSAFEIFTSGFADAPKVYHEVIIEY